MWYNFDVQKFGEQMLPPILRGAVLKAFLSAMLQPLVWLNSQFKALQTESRERLSSGGQSISLVEALRRTYDLREGDIYIVDAKDRNTYLYLLTEEQKTLSLYKQREATTPTYLQYSDEGRIEVDYTIYIPDFLEEKSAEEIQSIIEQYKPAGRKYQIKYYEYE